MENRISQSQMQLQEEDTQDDYDERQEIRDLMPHP
jgi:hypothetical protein